MTTHILAPVDLDEHTPKLIAYAAKMANQLAARLTVLHVVEPLKAMGDMVLGTVTIDEYNIKRIAHSKELMQKQLAQHPEASSAIVTGVIVDEIVKYAAANEVGLIIIGTHGSKGLEKLLLGSVAERVVKNAHCPTLVMNPYR